MKFKTGFTQEVEYPPRAGDEIAAYLATLDPFCPPQRYQFEPELCAPVPRPIPEDLSQGRLAQGQRRFVSGLFTTGVALLIASVMPFVHYWSLYLLPLAYLDWIGAGLIVWAAGAWVMHRIRKGPYRYVEHGTPLIARVCAQELRTTELIEGEPAVLRYSVLLQYQKPETGELALYEVNSAGIANREKEKVTSSYRVGDYATAIYLDDDPDATLQLYGFLDLRPGVGVIQREVVRKPSVWETVAFVAVLSGLILLLGLTFYAFQRYWPYRPGLGLVWAALLGAGFLGVPCIWLVRYQERWSRRSAEERNAEALQAGEPLEVILERSTRLGGRGRTAAAAIVMTCLLLGSVGAVTIALLANAMLDFSPPRSEPIQITERIMTTYRHVVRYYSFKYQFTSGNDSKVHSFLSTPEEMDRFNAFTGTAQIKEGWLGWPWIEELKPDVPSDGS